MSERIKLKPCPHCGTEPEMAHTSIYWVECPTCNYDGYESEAEAAAAWNKRQAQPAE